VVKDTYLLCFGILLPVEAFGVCQKPLKGWHKNHFHQYPTFHGCLIVLLVSVKLISVKVAIERAFITEGWVGY
jgi:hypothetical protein